MSIITQERWVTVADVFDGDTFRCTDGEKVRLLGINTPETMHGRQAAEPMGDEATRALSRLIEGKRVRLQTDTDRKDAYGRLLAQVWLADGTWVNGRMVEQGLAHVYTFAPNFRWAQPLLDKEAPAREKQLGIWHTSRFSVLDSAEVGQQHVGDFRVVTGRVSQLNRHDFRFRLDRLSISVPRKYRQWLTADSLPRDGQQVTVRGIIRAAGNKGLYLALHSPADLEVEGP